MRTAWLAAILLVALAPWTSAQGQGENCLTQEELRAVFSERGGSTWEYALVDKLGIESSSCVIRETRTVRYIVSGESSQVVQWIGTLSYGHWYRITGTGPGTIVLAERERRSLPPVPIRWVDTFQLSGVTLAVLRYTPPYVLIEHPWTFEYRVIRWTRVGDKREGAFIDYLSRPERLPDGSVKTRYAYYPQIMSSEQARIFDNRYSPAVMDFVEEGFFDKRS